MPSVGAARAAFEATIAKNSEAGGSSSRSFLSNVAAGPRRVQYRRRGCLRRRSMTTVEEIEYEYNMIVDGEQYHQHPLLTPRSHPKRTVSFNLPREDVQDNQDRVVEPSLPLELPLDVSLPVISTATSEFSIKKLDYPCNGRITALASAKLALARRLLSSNPQDSGMSSVAQVLEQVEKLDIYESEDLVNIEEEDDEDSVSSAEEAEVAVVSPEKDAEETINKSLYFPSLDQQENFLKARRVGRSRPIFQSPIRVRDGLRVFQKAPDAPVLSS